MTTTETVLVFGQGGSINEECHTVTAMDPKRDAQMAPPWSTFLYYGKVTWREVETIYGKTPTNDGVEAISLVYYVDATVLNEAEAAAVPGRGRELVVIMREQKLSHIVRTREGTYYPYVEGEHAIIMTT